MTPWHLRARTRVILRKIFRQDDSPARIARGIAAGFFATALPLPGLQIPLSLLFAWIARGNKVVALFPQFLSNAATMVPMALAQYKIGAWLWPGKQMEAAQATAAIRALVESWQWSAPLESVKESCRAAGDLGLHVLGPLAVGVLVTGLLMAAVSYPLAVIAVWDWRARRGRRRIRRYGRQVPRPPVLPEMPAPAPVECLTRYAWAPQHFQCAEGVKLLVDGREAYPEMLAAIDGAQTTADLETYTLQADRIGRTFQRALKRAVERGVQVRLLYDSLGSLGLPGSYIQELVAAGVSVAVYHPLVLLRPSWAINRRNHRKILLVDGRVAFMGGINITDDYSPPEEGGRGWRDTDLRLDGAQVAERLAGLFEYDWANAMPYAHTATPGDRLKSGMIRRLDKPIMFSRAQAETAAPIVCAPGGVAVQILGNEEFRYRRHIRRAYLHAIRRARRYILIENGYFIPDRGFRRALRRAARRGVLVGVLVARESDVKVAALASRNLYTELLSSGVRLFEWPKGMLHAKTAVIDDAWAAVGSYNLDHRSLVHQLEVVAVVADPVFARRLRDQTMADLAQCREVTMEEHEVRPWHEMLAESGAYLLRYWL